MKAIRAAGFTLIELLVVISILSLLVITFMPEIIGAWGQANQKTDAQQLNKHFYWINLYKDKLKGYPEGGGHEFVMGSWVKEICEHTPQNLAFYFTPGIRDNNDRYHELLKMDLDKLWPDVQSTTSQDTDYAGRRKDMKRDMVSGKEAWMANDQEGGDAFKDGSINVLYGDGVVRNLQLQLELKDYNWTKEQGPFPVGPESPHPDLKKLDK
jgi:prepilin-type N-terminal cleavage/methylation domain-containing protein